jgi:hypothetical protein
MRFGIIIILESRAEIQKTLEEAQRREGDGESYPFRFEGKIPNEKIGDFVTCLKLALDFGTKTTEFMFRE